jgi:hypothetical protein
MDRTQEVKQTFAIAEGAAVSTEKIFMQGFLPTGIITPAAWTAADISFLVSMDGTTMYSLYNAAGEVKIASALIGAEEARAFALNPADFAGWNYVQLRSGVNGTPVNQEAARALTLLRKPQ